MYILSHTHWDREWFITSDYTNKWLEKLFDELFKLFETHPKFHFIADGQTLIIEDLLSRRPDWRGRIEKLVRSGRLLIGPVYCQIDWRISPFFAIWKNFEIGKIDMEELGGGLRCGWFMDNFGHVSQLPQVMRLFGIDRAVLWRGVGGEGKEHIVWRSPDGSEVSTLFLIAGYRNLYNLRSTPDIVKERFQHEMEKVKPFGDIAILLDGYDLDLHPEDPRDFLDVEFEDSIEKLFKDLEKEKAQIVEGELICGKFASVFPGTLSTRSYLKIQAAHVGRLLLFRDILSIVLGKAPSYDEWRKYLKTLVHDNICGVGVDQIHDSMEGVYRELHRKIIDQIKDLVGRFNVSGKALLSISPFKFESGIVTDGKLLKVKMDGAGLWPVCVEDMKEREVSRVEKKGTYRFLMKDGRFWLDGKEIGLITVEKEEGDAYSSWTSSLDFNVNLRDVKVFERDGCYLIFLERQVLFDGGSVLTKERIFLDDLPMVRWEIDATLGGCCYKLGFGMEGNGEIFAGMPADVGKRPPYMEDLLPEDLPEELSKVLLAARETGKVKDMPFQDFVALREGGRTRALFAFGPREYRCEDGRLIVTLHRSVEWITVPVKGRIGDAGPLMYVPGARSERTVKFRLAFVSTHLHPKSFEFLSLVHFFVNWPIFIESKGGVSNYVKFGFDELVVGTHGKDLVIYDPKNGKLFLKELEVLRSRSSSSVKIIGETFPTSESSTLPDTKVLHEMERMRRKLAEEKKEIERILEDLEGLEKHQKTHRLLSINRTILELKLSELLCRKKLGEDVSDEEIGKVAFELNEARAKRRIYDYILELAKHGKIK